MKRMIALIACAGLLTACQTSENSAPSAATPDAKAMILANKNRLWKDADSIKGASITAPRRHMGMMWHVCVRANAKNSFGAYTGERDMLVGIYDDPGKPPSLLMTDATGYCDFPHEPFAELEGRARPKANDR